MIIPAGHPGAAFGTGADGNGRDDGERRRAISAELGVPDSWAWLRQVHGAVVHRAEGPGLLGDGDAAYTTVPGLPLTVATADCYPVALAAGGAAGIAHAGWRGAAAGVVTALREAMAAGGTPAVRAAIGPGIGPCCFEVGEEVIARFPGFEATTRWGTPSVDLAAALRRELDGLEVWEAGVCTHCDGAYHSYRRDGTDRRQVGVAWVA